MTRTRRRRRQGMTEYIILVGLIAILMVAAVTKFKDALANAFDMSTGQIEAITSQIEDGSSPNNASTNTPPAPAPVD